MKDYIDYVLRNERKPVEIEKIYKKIKELKRVVDPDYSFSSEDIEEISNALVKGIEEYEYYRTPKGKYTLLSKTSFRKGKFHGNKNAEGVVVCNTSYFKKNGEVSIREEKFEIKKDNVNNAVDGDTVLIDAGGNGHKPSIVKIIKRNIDNIVGTVTTVGTKSYVIPIDKKKKNLTIYLDGNAEDGSIVSVSLSKLSEKELEKYKESKENQYLGKISQIFVNNDGAHSDALFEAFKWGMPQGFSEASIKQLESIPMEVYDNEKAGREDYTNLEIFTIDGADTKDKDDAVSLRILPNGHYELGVHIADVNYYVKEGTPIDKDAFRKGTSYYFGGMVEPQLPPKLSNGICSLNENVERLTKSIIIEFDKNGNVVNRKLVPSVIKSRKSLTYENVNKVLGGQYVEEYLPFKDALKKMDELAKILRQKRLYGGAIIFNKPELKFIHDEMGNPTAVALRYDNDAENLIEEFMLAANNAVAEILTEEKIPCVYRVHDVPNSERLDYFLDFLNAINMPYEFNTEEIIKDKEILQGLILHISKNAIRVANSKSFSDMLNTNLVRCMSHASYSTKNIGHYGVGSETYCHFTSPIRRIADLAISRIIDECYFEKNEVLREQNIKKWADLAIEYAAQASKMERVSEDVEKNVLYMDAAAYLSNYIGQEFEATVVTLSNNGICVQLDNLLEGKVRNRYLDGEYVYNQRNFTLVALDGKGNYYVGDRLRLRLINTSKETKSVDFVVLEKIYENTIKDKNKSNQYVKSKAIEKRRMDFN